MTKRKFTPPTEFPAEYVISDGCKVVILGEMPHPTHKLAGYVTHKNGDTWIAAWTDHGKWIAQKYDLHDLPKKQVNWLNDYGEYPEAFWCNTRQGADYVAHIGRIAVIRREWIEGQLPQYFTEEV